MDNNNDNKTKRQKTGNLYLNYTISSNDEKIDIITDISKLSPKSFFNDYIAIRKPVKFVTPSDQQVIQLNKFELENLVDTLNYNDEELQVEKKYQAGFGSGQKRIKMKLSDLVNEIKNGNDEYYLTTQYDFDDSDRASDEEEEGEEQKEDEDEEDVEEEGVPFDQFSDTSSIDMNNLHDDFEDIEDDFDESANDEENNKDEMTAAEAEFRIKELYQPPLTNLVNHPEILPYSPSFFNLVPQQINLWMGSSSTNTNIKETHNNFTIDESKPDLGLGKQLPGESPRGTSTGLHHDHADNLYILVLGKKRFTILSPNDAIKLYTVGNIYKIFNSGIIDYEIDENAPGWKHVRDDGAIIEEIIYWQLDKFRLADNGHDKEAEQKLLNELQVHIKQHQAQQKALKTTSGIRRDPPSFSKIPPALLHLDELKDESIRKKIEFFANKFFSGVLQLNKLEVWLNPGEMLYLPAGWFHEVSSFGSDNNKDNIGGAHIAINYWFIPPNTTNFDNCYEDSYWKEDWEKTKQAMQLVKDGVVNL